MDNLYAALLARGKAQDTTNRIKYWGKWNNDLERMKDGRALGFQLPAVLIQLKVVGIMDVGGGVQLLDVEFTPHVLTEFYNESSTGAALNLDIYDLGRDVQQWYQGYQVTGDEYGSSAFTRRNIEDDDEEWEKVYEYKPVYMANWVDNTTKYPRGGTLAEGPFDAAITGEFSQSDEPSLVASLSSLDFGNVPLGNTSTLTFTIEGENLQDDEPAIISTTNGDFLITVSTTYKTRLALSPVDGEITETTVTVKFTPRVSGGATGSILYGVPGINGEITLLGSGVGMLLLEDGSRLLLEDGSSVLL
jgi:hypothetical protein